MIVIFKGGSLLNLAKPTAILCGPSWPGNGFVVYKQRNLASFSSHPTGSAASISLPLSLSLLALPTHARLSSDSGDTRASCGSQRRRLTRAMALENLFCGGGGRGSSTMAGLAKVAMARIWWQLLISSGRGSSDPARSSDGARIWEATGRPGDVVVPSTGHRVWNDI